MGLSLYTLKVTSVSEFQSLQAGYVYFRGVPLDTDKRQTTAKVVFAKVKNDILPMIPTVGQQWVVQGNATQRVAEKNGYRYIAIDLDVISAKVTMPDCGETFISFLSSCADFKGVGEVKAREIWSRFGKAIYSILTNKDMASLLDVLSENTALALINSWAKYSNLQYMEWFAEHSIPPAISGKVIRYYDKSSIRLIQSDIYRLLAFGMTFDQVDSIAVEKFTIQKNDPRRLVAAVEQALDKWTAKGHTYGDYNTIRRILANILKDNALVDEALSISKSNGAYIVSDEGFYHPTGMLVIESVIAKRFKKLAQIKTWDSSHDDAYDGASAVGEYPLTVKQGEALYNALSCGISAIFGGAGTGKTTVIKSIIVGLETLGYQIYPMALSGRAAKRLREATGRKTSTIAAFLRKEPVLSDKVILVIDEAAMVDVKLMYQIISHVPPSVRILLVGDPDQLPPIGGGLVLHAIQKSNAIVKTTLDIVQRQSDESGIPEYSNYVKSGIVPSQLSKQKVFFHDVSEQDINFVVTKLYAESPDVTQILGATYSKKYGGIDALNLLCQQSVNHDGCSLMFEIDDQKYGLNIKVNDPVIFVQNNQSVDIQNGTLGKQIDVNQTAHGFGKVKIDDGREIDLTMNLIDHIRLAYCISLHKAQGSQFDRVIIPIVPSSVMDRGWIYTAITRAVKEVHIVGCPDLFAKHIQRPSKSHIRQVFLSKLLDMGN